jgi:hypothetical protein
MGAASVNRIKAVPLRILNEGAMGIGVVVNVRMNA